MIYIVLLIVAGLVIALVVTGLSSKKDKTSKQQNDRPADCCGAHEVCESDSLLSSSEEVVYYEDEELDLFKDKPGNSYNDDEIEQFREVLYTLQEKEVAAWLKSLQLRGITPPDIIKEESLMIVADRRGR